MALINIKKTAVFFYAISVLAGKALAVDIHVTITGQVFIPACQINNGKTIEVNFGDISTEDVANEKNRRVISIPVVCDFPQGTAYVRVTGQALGSNTNVLATDVTNFGIALYQGEGTATKLLLGAGTGTASGSIGYPITAGLSGKETGTFVFTAVPFKAGTASLEARAFSASASISISYI